MFVFNLKKSISSFGENVCLRKRYTSMTPTHEEFTPDQEALLSRFVTNTKGSIFALHNLPEVVKGALFSRYSRSTLGLRTLLLREFIMNEEESWFKDVVGKASQDGAEEQYIAIKRAQNFYDRVLYNYGDDSIAELGGAHLAIENISMLAAKAIEDCRIGGSPLEKSTRYAYFDQKVGGEYLFHREAVLMTSAWRPLYIATCNMLFDTYSKLHASLMDFMSEKYPRDPEIAKGAYAAAIRAKVLDCVRGLLPASALTNMGLFGNGRFFEGMLHKLQCENLAELNDIGKAAYEELSKVIPSFVRRAEPCHKTHRSYSEFQESMREDIQVMSSQVLLEEEEVHEPYVRLVSCDPEAVIKIAAALLYKDSDKSFEELLEYCRELDQEEIARILDSAVSARQQRRHKSPRALENALFTFEFLADFGAYRDFQRHRMLTQERQLLTCNHGYYIPEEIVEAGFEKEYRGAMDEAKAAFDTISKELPEEAQYVVPMAYNIRWYWTLNLRSVQWLTELRSQAAGHTCYRRMAQQMAHCIEEKIPALKRFLGFVDYEERPVGRLEQEVRSEKKVAALTP